jgi:hypothetical protein
MKTLEEKKLLVKMARAFGQPVEQELLDSIEKEERLNEALFGIKKVEAPKIPILKEEPIVEVKIESIPQPAKAFEPIIAANTVQQTMNVMNTVAPTLTQTLQKSELDGIKRTISDLVQKINTLSWGGGGTGAVRIIDQDDLDKSTVANGRYMKYMNGMFVMDEINPFDVIHNTTLVTTNTYTVQDNDYYIGVNHAGPVTIVIPSVPDSGREIVIKDESGNCEIHNITISGPIDNDANGAILAINNGALHMLFRGDYWRII